MVATHGSRYFPAATDGQQLADNQPPGQTRRLDDGRVVPLLPQRIRWIWDGDFCGQINLRWQPGTTDLPEWVLGHIGYAVVPWKRNRDYAQRALRHMLSEAREVGLTHVDLSTPETNAASQRVINVNGGALIETITSALYDPSIRRQRYRIALT
jgi:predicted acetyltransferase